MSADGSAFGDGAGGEFLQKATKRAKFESETTVVDSPANIMDGITGEPNSHIPVPQSDFEIVINSTSQDGETPSEELALSPQELSNAGITIVGQSRSLSEIEASLASSSSETIPLTQDAVITAASDLTSLSANGREILSSITHPASIGELSPSGQFLLSSSGVDNNQSSGPLYVMIPPGGGTANELIQAMQQNNQRPIIPRVAAGLMPLSPGEDKSSKEQMRKQTHNEVERRRRDRINELIKTLAEIVPGCQKKDATSGNIVGYVYSKGTVLEKTVEYLKELLTMNEQLSAAAKLAEKSSSALQVLQNQITVLEKENAFLRSQMIQLGIENTAGTLNTRSLLSSPLAQSLLNSQAAAAAAANPPVPSTTQLLVSLAQTLSANPLLASLAQNTAALQAAAAAAASTPSTSTLTTSPSLPPFPPPSSTPQISQSLQTQLNSSSNAQQVMNTLVQTLASIATTNTSPSQPPSVQTTPSNLTAAASLLNSLIMAQNALTNTSTSPSNAMDSSSQQAASNLAASVLSAVAEATKDKNAAK